MGKPADGAIPAEGPPRPINPAPDWLQPEPDYDLVYPRIVRTLERLCAACGFNNVLAVFSGDMPCHRHERGSNETRRVLSVVHERAGVAGYAGATSADRFNSGRPSQPQGIGFEGGDGVRLPNRHRRHSVAS